MEAGEAVAYALFRLQDRGTFFIEPGTKVYAGMVVGENNREQRHPRQRLQDEAADQHARLGLGRGGAPRAATHLTLEQAIEWLGDDEYLEVTPKSLRMRKRYLDPSARSRAGKARGLAGVG